VTELPKDYPGGLAFGAYAKRPTDEDLAAAERAEERPALTARLTNALYGPALAHVTAERNLPRNAPILCGRPRRNRAFSGRASLTAAPRRRVPPGPRQQRHGVRLRALRRSECPHR
jgi:hypothetical protein